jgi:protein-tyrosine-phosphatase/predicted ATP-grasp superfamily ATP-dependent carboligase
MALRACGGDSFSNPVPKLLKRDIDLLSPGQQLDSRPRVDDRSSPVAENTLELMADVPRSRATAVAPTVIIIGEEPRVMVTIARSLHRHGIRSIVAVPDRMVPRMSSRAIADTVHLGRGVDDAARFLRMFAESERSRWVVPAGDWSLGVLDAAYEDLSRLGVVGGPPPHIVQRVLDNSAVFDAAARCGIPVCQPLPIEKESKSEGGRDSQTIGVDVLISAGKLVASFQHRSPAENPLSGGVAVVTASEPVDPVLLDHAVRLLRELEWDGMATVEFHVNRSTRAAALLGVHGSFRGSLPLAVAAGVDFPYYAWQISQGIAPTPPAPYRNGLRVRWTAGSLNRFARAFTNGADRLPLRDAIRQLLADFRPGTRSATWSWADPLPAMQEVASVLGGWSSEWRRRTASALLPESTRSVFRSSRTLPPDRRAIYLKRCIVRLAGRDPEVKLPAVIGSVIFVCHGNIMRSASAAQFLRDDLRAAGITDIRITSAGTHARNGKPADPRVRRAVRDLGSNLEDHHATLLTADLVASSDVIFAMDEMNYANIITAFPHARGKLMLFGGVNAAGVYWSHEIADPYVATEGEVAATVSVVRRYVAALALAIAQRRDSSAGAGGLPSE